MTSLPKMSLPIPVVLEFLESVAAIYQDLLSGKNPNTVIVPTSSSGQHRQRPALGDAGMLDGVEASLFYQRLENLCDRHKYRWDMGRGPTSAPEIRRSFGNRPPAECFDCFRFLCPRMAVICHGTCPKTGSSLSKEHFHQERLAEVTSFLKRKHLLFETFPRKGKVKLSFRWHKKP